MPDQQLATNHQPLTTGYRLPLMHHARLIASAILGFLMVLSAGSCASTQPPASAPAPEKESRERPIGAVIVTASKLNVREQPSGSGKLVHTVRRGDRLVLLGTSGEWSRVRLSDAKLGWVASKFVRNERREENPKCPADRPFAFSRTPVPRFSERGPHGLVSVEADVDARGIVRSLKVVTNTTGSSELGRVAEQELRGVQFIPPVRNCMAVRFIYTYKRAF